MSSSENNPDQAESDRKLSHMHDKIILDSTKLKEAVISVKVIKMGEGTGGKFLWNKVIIIQEYKNESTVELSREIEIAHYSFEEGLPNEECIVYLTYFPLGRERLNKNPNRRWILLKGDGAYGVDKIKPTSNKY